MLFRKLLYKASFKLEHKNLLDSLRKPLTANILILFWKIYPKFLESYKDNEQRSLFSELIVEVRCKACEWSVIKIYASYGSTYVSNIINFKITIYKL